MQTAGRLMGGVLLAAAVMLGSGALTGCESTRASQLPQSVPAGAALVGAGPVIHFVAPSSGTVYLVDRDEAVFSRSLKFGEPCDIDGVVMQKVRDKSEFLPLIGIKIADEQEAIRLSRDAKLYFVPAAATTQPIL